MGNRASKDIYSLGHISDNMVDIIFLLKPLSSYIIFYGVRWVGCLHNSLLGLIFNPVIFLIAITIVYNIYMVGVMRGKIDISNMDIIFSFNNIIIISSTNLFTDGVKFKLEIGL